MWIVVANNFKNSYDFFCIQKIKFLVLVDIRSEKNAGKPIFVKVGRENVAMNYAMAHEENIPRLFL
jgi:hypothetical protein